VIRSISLDRASAHDEEDDFNVVRFEDNEEEEDTCLTKFNEMCQKGVAGLRIPRYQYGHKSDVPGAAPFWKCKATTSALKSDMTEPMTLSVVVRGKTKKDARRLAAKQMLEDLLRFGIVTQDIVDSKTPPALETAEELEASGAGVNGISSPDVAAAVSVLNQLWQKEKFVCKPKWCVVPVSTGSSCGWKCDLLIKTKHFGDIESSFTSTQKKTCRQMAAFKAVQRLRDMNYPGLDAVNINARRQSNVSTEAPQLDSEDDESSYFEDEPDDRTVETLNVQKDDLADIAKRSAAGEEQGASAPFAGGDAGFGSLFSIPNDTKIVIATGTTCCDDWVSSKVLGGCALGVYVDSCEARRTLKSHDASSGVDLDPAAPDSECRVICLASQDSVLVVCSDYFREARAATQNESAEEKNKNLRLGPDELIVDLVRSKCNHTIYPECNKGSWIPVVIRRVLERPDCIKYGMTLDEGALVLRVYHGVACRGFTDLGISSFALKGMVSSRQQLLASPAELVSEWLCCRLDPFSRRAFGHSAELCEVPQPVADNVVSAALIAAASQAIQKRIIESAESRRRKRYVNTEEFAELCDRLCADVTSSLAPSKEPRNAGEGATEQHDDDCKLIPMPVA
jgi:hypothetical protein